MGFRKLGRAGIYYWCSYEIELDDAIERLDVGCKIGIAWPH